MAINKEISSVASVAMPIDENWTVRRCRYAPEEDAKARLCIATGMHGDEMMGQLILYLIACRIKAAPQHLHGIVDLYPSLNPMGLDIGERMVPMSNMLDMNRAFPGSEQGTAMEGICFRILKDMTGADLVLDIHASTQNKSELYEVRMSANTGIPLMQAARALQPDLIWIYPDSDIYNASLTGALTAANTPALILEVDERHTQPQLVAERAVQGIFCQMKQMGIWSGEAPQAPGDDVIIPCIHTRSDVARITCEHPGVYIPDDCIGRRVEAGTRLGIIIDALEGTVLETVSAPEKGLVFSQRTYSAVYPGTLIARIYRKETP